MKFGGLNAGIKNDMSKIVSTLHWMPHPVIPRLRWNFHEVITYQVFGKELAFSFSFHWFYNLYSMYVVYLYVLGNAKEIPYEKTSTVELWFSDTFGHPKNCH